MANEAAIEQALTALLEERAEIDQAIAALQRRLGRSVASSATASGTSGGSMPLSGCGEIVAHPGEFHQHSITQAADKILRRAGRPVKTSEILAALQRAEFETASRNPSQSLYTALARHKGFLRVRPNTWALAEWFPNAPTKSGDVEPKRRRRRGRKAPKLLMGKNTEKAETSKEPQLKAG